MEQDRAVPLACPSVRWITLLLSLVICVVTLVRAQTVHAKELHLIVNGRSIHFNERPAVAYNESNWGAGLQYDMADKRAEWVPFVTLSGFNDSNRNPSYYAGGGVLNRTFYTIGEARYHTDLGVVAFLMTRKGFRDGDPFFGVLPVFSIGTDNVAVNMTFVPRVDPKAVPLLFFQLKLNIDLFR